MSVLSYDRLLTEVPANRFDIIDFCTHLPNNKVNSWVTTEDGKKYCQLLNGYEFKGEETNDIVKPDFLYIRPYELYMDYIASAYGQFMAQNNKRDQLRQFGDYVAGYGVTKDWLRYKQLYLIPKDLQEVLAETELDAFDKQFFEQIKYDTIFIQFEQPMYSVIGAFVQRNRNEHIIPDVGVTYTIYFVDLYKFNGKYMVPTQADCVTVTDELRKMSECTGIVGEQVAHTAAMINLVLKAMAFINAANVGFKSTTKPTTFTKRNYNTGKATVVKTNYTVNVPSVRIHYYGKEITERQSDPNASKANSSGWHVRPHIRRAHSQGYWVGSGDERKLVIKQKAQVFVNGLRVGEEVPTPLVKNLPTKKAKEKSTDIMQKFADAAGRLNK